MKKKNKNKKEKKTKKKNHRIIINGKEKGDQNWHWQNVATSAASFQF